MSETRKQINVRVTDEVLQMIGDLQRADRSSPTAPTITDVIIDLIKQAHGKLPKEPRRR